MLKWEIKNGQSETLATLGTKDTGRRQTKHNITQKTTKMGNIKSFYSR